MLEALRGVSTGVQVVIFLVVTFAITRYLYQKAPLDPYLGGESGVFLLLVYFAMAIYLVKGEAGLRRNIQTSSRRKET